MYSREEWLAAVKLYIKYDFASATVRRELGYPLSKTTLRRWYEDYLEQVRTNIEKRRYKRKSKYSDTEKKAVVDYYLEHGKSLTNTIRKMGYPCRPVLMKWIDELAPGQRRLRTYTQNNVQYNFEQKKEAVVNLCTRGDKSAENVAKAAGVTRCVLYKWKYDLLGKECDEVKIENNDHLPNDIGKLQAIAKSLQEDIVRLELERDILEGTLEIVKKGPSADSKTLTNKEKTVLIGALKKKYPLKMMLKSLKISKSSYFYQVNALVAADKYEHLKKRIRELFYENKERYGYRRIHALLKAEKKRVSEKIVQRIMGAENLKVKGKKTKRYSSYAGEVTLAPKNIIARDFHATNPNEKWLTDITEFAIPAGKVYLSPIIDCFDGMAVSWSISTSPSAEMANSSLKAAISTLAENEKPLVHSDRGGHVRQEVA